MKRIHMDTTAILGALTTAIAGLAAAVAHLWRASEKKATETETRLNTKLDNCEQQHKLAQQEMATIREQVGEMRGRIEARNEVKQSIEELSSAVLLLVNKKNEETPEG